MNILEFNGWSLALIGFFSGLGNAAGQSLYNEYLKMKVKKHGGKIINHLKKIGEDVNNGRY